MCRPRKGIPMKKETTKKSKLWIWIVIAAVLLLAAGGVALALLGGGQNVDTPPATDPVVTGPRANLYWNIDREFYTANSQTGLSTREADADGKFKMKFAYNGEIVELVIVDKKLVNIIDTQDVVGLTFDENGVVIGQINVRELATEVGKKVYVKKATADMIQANSSMAMNGMELNLKLGQYSEIYDLREGSETYGQKINPDQLGVMDCMTVYANADGDNTHFFILSAATRSKIYWRGNPWVSATVNRGGLDPDENGVYTLPFYCEGELVQIKTKDVELVDYYAEMGKHSGFTGLIFDDEGFAIDIINAAVGAAGQQTIYAMDIEEINGNYVKLKANWSTSGAQAWEGELPLDTPVYNVSTWAMSEGVMGQKISVTDLRVGDRITMFSDMEGNPIEIGVTLRRVDMKPMFSNSSKYDAATRSTTRVKDEDGYYTFTFIDEKGIHKYKTKDHKLASFIDSYPERLFGIVTKGDILVKAYEYDCLFGQVRFSTALYVDSINGTIISCTDQKKANAYTAVLSEDYKVLDISGDSKQWGQKIKLQIGDCMISFRNTNKEVCLIYVTKRTQGGSPYIIAKPDTSRPITQDVNENGEVTAEYWLYEATDMNGKQVTLKLPVGKYDEATKSYANKYLQSRIDGASRGIIALEVSKGTIKDAHAISNMASGNSVGTVIITKAGTAEFEYKTAAKADATVYPGWTGKEGVKMINLSGDYKSHAGEKLTGGMKVGDVYYMIRNRANETVALILTSRGFHNNLFLIKNPYPVVNGVTTRPVNADGFYVFSVMYAGKPATVKTKDVEIATKMEGYRTGAALKLDKAAGNVVLAANDYKCTNDAYESVVSNWDVSKISGTKITLTLNIPTTSTTVGDTKELDIKGAKIYNISPNAGDDFGKVTKLQKNDRVRIYTDKNGAVSYVLVTVRNGLKNAYCAHCDKKVNWNPLTATSGLGQGNAHYYIYDNWDVTSQLSVSNTTIDYEAVLDLNGKTTTQAGNNARLFMVAYGETLTILDSVGGGVLQGYGNAPNGEPGQGNVVQVSYGSTLNILGGTLKQLEAEGKVPARQGGLIFSYSTAEYGRNTINIKGGTLIGGATNWDLANNKFSTGVIGTFLTDVTMYDGVITGGTADRGGNVNVSTSSTFVMKGGEISNGTARNRGGNIFADSTSTVTIEGGKIFGGTTTGQMGGNIYGHTVNVTGGEIYNGKAATTGGNIFLLGDNNALTISGGKIYDGTSASGGGNIYVYGGEGVVAITGGEVLGGTSPNGQNIFMGLDASTPVKASALYLSGGTVSGGIYIAADGAVMAEGAAKVGEEFGGIRFAAGSGMVVGQLADTAYLPVKADGAFATGSEGVDVETYLNKQIVSTDATCKLVVETIDGAKWLVANIPSLSEIGAEIAQNAVQMTTDKVFAAGDVVTADCPVCNKSAQWAPLTADLQKLNETEYTHFYLPGNIDRPSNSMRYYVESGEICVHLNGFTYDQKATSACEGAFKVSANSILNLMGNGKVIGAGGYYAASAWPMGGAIDARGTVNIYGGTYMSSHNRPAVATFAGNGAVVNMFAGEIVANSNATSAPGSYQGTVVMTQATQTFNMYGGSIYGADAATNGNVKLVAGTFNVFGGEISGRVVATASAKISINNGAKIGAANGGLVINGATVTLAKDLAEGTKVYISDPVGVGAALTVANAKAADYANVYILSADAEKTLKVDADNQLYFPSDAQIITVEELDALLDTPVPAGKEYHETICPICRKSATWIPLSAETKSLTNGHYYLAGDLNFEGATRFTTSGAGAVICVHLNGHTYNQGAVKNAEGAFKVAGDTTLNIMGNGTVIGYGTYVDSVKNYTAGAIDARGNVNIYGGTYKSSAADRPAVGCWNGTGIINMYGGEIVKGDAIDVTADGHESVRVRTGAFTLHGGVISGGMAVNGGTFTVNGGTINGGVFTNGGTVVINKGANIEATNGGLTIAGATVKLADNLDASTKVFVTDGAGTGAPLTVANAKAAEYAQTIICAADSTKVVKADADNQLYVAAE